MAGRKIKFFVEIRDTKRYKFCCPCFIYIRGISPNFDSKRIRDKRRIAGSKCSKIHFISSNEQGTFCAWKFQITLSTYQSYKKARNLDAYFQKHESEIILHGGAKRMLEQVGFNVKKIDIDKLKTELSRLESQKKEHSSTYKMLAKK